MKGVMKGVMEGARSRGNHVSRCSIRRSYKYRRSYMLKHVGWMIYSGYSSSFSPISLLISSVMLDTLPPDVLEHIAYHASTHKLLGPPSDLITLITLCRSTSATLRRSANPHLYARIFAAKFDLTAPRRRLSHLFGTDAQSVLSVTALADELVRRFTVLKRLRAEKYARTIHSDVGTTHNIHAFDVSSSNTKAEKRLDELLWVAFLMVLEDEGRNVAQLLDARVEAWLAVFWFDPQGASGAARILSANCWPLAPIQSFNERLKMRQAFAMWLFWFFLDPGLCAGSLNK